jgi:hypothetical protein
MELPKVSGTGLCNGIEEGVPASDIGTEWMLHADTILEMNPVGLAGTTAIGMIFALGEECREDAVLHMKHRHVLVDGQLKPLRGRLLEKVQHLGQI